MSLDLDDRQRAMLHEMGVHVWWPKGDAALAQAPAAAPSALAASIQPKVENAPVTIANNIDNTGAKNPFNAQSKAGNVASMNWLTLKTSVTSCQACKLCESRKNTVFGVGQMPLEPQLAPRVDWMVVGEAPGENEDRIGEPFVGQAGQLLDNMLKAMKLSRQNNVYIANVIKCRPPHNRNPEPTEIASCEPYLHRQIELLQPKIILAMGKFAATTLLRATVPDVDKTPLGRLRGQVHVYQHGGLQIPVIATYHPAYLLRSLQEKAKAWADLCLAMAEMRRMA